MTLDTMRKQLLTTTILCGALFAPHALAQTAPTETAQTTAAVAEDAEEIIVTGSLIRNPNLVAATPVNVVGEDELNLRQTSVAEEILRELPGVVPNIGSAVNNGNGGASFVDLRGLGSNRNVVLLDGVRIVPTDTLLRFDLNNVPVALVQSVQVTTGGASTTYGADAVAGVVNFLTKQDFAGVELQFQEGITERGDGNRLRVDLTVGANTDDGRGNVVLSIGYQEVDPIYQGARDYSRTGYNSFGIAAPSGSGTSVPSRFANVNPLGLDNNPVGDAVTQGTRQVNATGDGFVPTAVTIPFNFNPFNIFQTPFERYNIYGAGRYEVADGIEIYARGIFSKNTVNTIIAPSGSFGATVTINLNNPFLSAAQRNGFCQFDTNSGAGYSPLFTRAQCDAAAAPALRPGDADYRTVTTSLSRRAVEIGPRISTFTTEMFDYRAGVKIDVTDSIEFDAFGAYGESRRDNYQSGYTNDDAFRQSALAVRDGSGNNVCINPANGCVPANFFGVSGSISPEAATFLSAQGRDVFDVSLGQARATLSGEAPFSSPLTDNKVSFALGAEYREYSAEITPDFATSRGLLGGSGGRTTPVSGGYDVIEGVGEINIPLISDRPGFHNLTIGGGVRYSSYSVNAPGSPSYDTTTWKAEASWEPIDGFRLRGNYAFASRAPNVNELFSPVNTTLTNLSDDPCANFDDNGVALPGRAVPTGVLRDVCILQGAPPGLIGAIQVPTAGQANTTGGGNLGLHPEDSDSWTVGAVIDAVPGLLITIDYYNIVVTNAITVPSSDDAIESCFGAAFLSVSNPACAAIGRNPFTGQLSGPPSTTSGVSQSFSNLGRIETDGIDLQIGYTREVGAFNLGFNFLGNYTRSSKFQSTPASINRECVGYFSSNCGSILPEFQSTTRFSVGWNDLDLSLLWRHIDAVSFEPTSLQGTPFRGTIATGPQAGRVVDFGNIPSYDYFDLSLRVNVTDNVSLNFLVANLTDKQPPFVGADIGSTTFNSGNTFPSTYDPLGRRYSVSGRVRF